MLGHKNASMTLDVYADLFDSDLMDVARLLDAAVQVETGVEECGQNVGKKSAPRSPLPQREIGPVRPQSTSWSCLRCRTGPNLKTGRKLFHQDFVDGKIFTVTLK